MYDINSYIPNSSFSRLYVIKKCPMLVHEMVTCISQLILLAHAGRIGRLPSLDTIEYAMKLCPMIVQALWDKQSPLLQLPHIEEDQLKHFHSRKRNIKSLAQLAKMKVTVTVAKLQKEERERRIETHRIYIPVGRGPEVPSALPLRGAVQGCDPRPRYGSHLGHRDHHRGRGR